jgi:hypothetical protein
MRSGLPGIPAKVHPRLHLAFAVVQRFFDPFFRDLPTRFFDRSEELLVRGGKGKGCRLGVSFAITRNVGPVSHGVVGLFRSARQPLINRRIQVFGKLLRRSLQIGDNLDATLLLFFVLKPPWLRPGGVLRVFGTVPSRDSI